MTRQITLLLAIMLCCLLGLLVMQGYLAYQEFQRQRADFTTQVNKLFTQAVAAEKEARLDQLVQLFLADLDNPELVRIAVRRDRETPRAVFDLYDAGTGELEMSIAFEQMAFTTETMTMEMRRRLFDSMEKEVRKDLSEGSVLFWTQALGERLQRNFRELPVDTATLSAAFRTKLDSVGIGSTFSLLIDTAFTAGMISSAVKTIHTAPKPLFGQDRIGEQQALAVIDNPGYVIFRRSLFTIGGSAAVILLTLLSFYLLFATILRQKALARMKDDFIDNITHELQTPISALRLALDGLRPFEVTDQKARFARYLQVSASELDRLSELVDGILLHSTAGETPDKESLDLMELLREATDRHRRKADKPVSIQLPERDACKIVSSRFHLQTILDNLLQNAIRYSAEQGVHIDIRLETKGEGLVLEIADDGWGIPPEDRRRIFDKFYRSSDKDRNYTVKGLGIGLYHVRHCVKALGGSIRVRDNRPRGTVMEVRWGR